jgi:predicted nucleic acid-binding Zn ribbon protein
MPIYEYRCECGATLEALEPMGTRRERCGELCSRKARSAIPPGSGHLERILSATGIRGDGREAKAPVFDPVRQQNRPGGCEDCDSSDGEAFS